MMDEQQIAELLAMANEEPDLITRELCKKSFYEFVKYFWDTIIDAKPVWNWHIKYLCDELQVATERVIQGKPKEYDIIINISPGSTKSTIVSQMLNAWAWTIAPWMRFIAGSYSTPLSYEHATYTRDIVQSDKYLRLFPDVKLREDKTLLSNFKTTKGGQRFSTSTKGTVTGVHAHVITVDDPQDPNEVQSDVEREKANSWLDKTLSSRKVNKAVSLTIIVMQRLHQNDCTGHILSKDGKRIKHICLPADDSFEIKPNNLREFYKDGLMDPIRLSQDVLDEAQADMGPVEFGGQYGQNPMSRDGSLFPPENWKFVDAAPAGGFVVRGWDLAATESSSAAYTVGLRMKLVDGQYYIEHVVRFKGSPGTVENTIVETANYDGKGVFIDYPQDPGQAGKAQAVAFSKKLAGFMFAFSPETGSKVTRAGSLSAQQMAGNVFIVKGNWNKAFIEEAEMFPVGKFMDQVDAASRAFHALVKLQSGDAGDIAGAVFCGETNIVGSSNMGLNSRLSYSGKGVISAGIPLN